MQEFKGVSCESNYSVILFIVPFQEGHANIGYVLKCFLFGWFFFPSKCRTRTDQNCFTRNTWIFYYLLIKEREK